MSSLSTAHWRLLFAVIPVMLGLTHPAFANPLTFDEALATALRSTPTLSANAAMETAARQSAIPAGELPDPRLVVGIDNLPITSSDRFSVTRDFMTMRRIGIMQEFPNADKRAARAEVAKGRVAVAEAQTLITRQSVLRETAIAWIGRETVEQQLAYINALLEENRLLDAAVRARLAGGKGMTADTIAPRQEAAMIEERRDAFEARRTQAIAALRRWIGPAANAPLQGKSPDWPITRARLEHQLHQHPEISAFDSKENVLNAEIKEAQAEKKSDWSFEIAYQKRGPQFSDMLSFQASYDLRLFTEKRQDPMIAAKRAERIGLDAEREAIVREHAAMLESELADFERLNSALKRQRDVMLPLAKEKVDLAMADWQGGRGNLSDVIIARREHIDAKLRLIEISGERSAMAARLYYAYAEPAGAKP